MIESQTTFIFKPMANNVCMGHFYHHHARKDIDMRFRYIIFQDNYVDLQHNRVNI